MLHIVFMGTPEFAVPSLTKLIQDQDIKVELVITQPDRPVGRKQIITPPPVKVLAQSHKVEIAQAEKINKDEKLLEQLEKIKADFIVTVAYGQILKSRILDLAPIINVHASLLPEYRGPAPINWMLINGDNQAGVTTMLTDPGVDTGDILLKQSIDVNSSVNAAELTESLSHLGASLLIKTLKDFENITPLKQDQSQIEEHKKKAPFMDKNLGELKFENPALKLHNLVRGTYPWPGAYFKTKDGNKIIVTKTTATQASNLLNDFHPGQISSINKEKESFSIKTKDGDLEIFELKAQGKKQSSGLSWLNGQRLKSGDFI